ncbi:hypothetical protein SBC1_70880 (plasmid) [Caballeronia sp. SBC1]|uniref:ABC-three component system middle component 6 n=1 Tax=unclassified Caballeronia TaxID=2646786 RepID=UPI0013E1F59D|nr:hypothetical protein SBC2_70620 [Caballeronia sp. SBC2]QIN67041.1 hypothetical protein SBC1_70880 [Caballeronia sp. SBC1]
MLLPDDIHPTLSLYYNGGLILEALKKLKVCSLLDLYAEVRKFRDVTMPILVLSLDWLFIIDLIKFNLEGDIELCS